MDLDSELVMMRNSYENTMTVRRKSRDAHKLQREYQDFYRSERAEH